MKKLFGINPAFLLLLSLLIVSSCGKYDDGPWFSIYSKKERVSGNWNFGLVRIDGEDKTDDYSDQQLRLSKNGNLFWVKGYLGSYWNPYGPGGEWKFVDNKNQIQMNFIHEVEEEFTLVWDIKRMAYGDLRLERYEDGKKIEWQFWKY